MEISWFDEVRQWCLSTMAFYRVRWFLSGLWCCFKGDSRFDERVKHAVRDGKQTSGSLYIGMTYDRASIEKWLDEGNSVCPVTLEFLQSKELTPNHTLRRLIQDWCVANSSNGVLRIPTPKPVAERSKVRQMIQDIQDVTINKFEALRNLRSLAKVSERNRQCLKSEGVLPVLIHILDSEASLISEEGVDREAVEEAVGAISLFPVNDISIETGFIRPSVLATLEWVLAKCTLEARMDATSIVEKLANDRNSAREIGSREGITDGLLKLFQEDLYSPAIKASLKALFPLSTVLKSRTKMAKAGAVPRLIELLRSADTDMVEQSLAILEAVSTFSEGRSAILGHTLAVPSIVRSLLAVSDTATDYAVGILLGICFNSAEEELLRELVEMGTLERLLFLLQMECSPRTKQKASDLIRILSGPAPE